MGKNVVVRYAITLSILAIQLSMCHPWKLNMTGHGSNVSKPISSLCLGAASVCGQHVISPRIVWNPFMTNQTEGGLSSSIYNAHQKILSLHSTYLQLVTTCSNSSKKNFWVHLGTTAKRDGNLTR